MIERSRLNLAMQQLAQGDRESFDVVFNGVEPVARRVATAMLRGNPSGLDDAVQSAMTKLFSQSHAFDPEGDVIRWLVTLTVWECRTLQKQRARMLARGTSYDDNAVTSRAQSPEDEAVEADTIAALRDVLGHMSELDREVLLHSASPSAINRKRRQRATERLKALWKRYHGQQ